MLPFIYPDCDANKLLEDVEDSSIPSLHKAMFNWIKGYTRESSQLTSGHIEELRALGVTDVDLVEWANVASTQTWFVMSADGGGIPLESDAVVGSVIGLERESYEARNAETVPGKPASEPATTSSCCWVDTSDSNLNEVSGWLIDRYGGVPNLFKATSLTPHYLPAHVRALELLEGPQSKSLSARQHAMVRRLVNRRNQGRYFNETTRHLLAAFDDQYQGEFDFSSLPAQDQVVLGFADKLVRHAYKVTEKDAQGFRDAGLDDEVYVDVLNTVSIQTSLDRLTNALGVKSDAELLLVK